MWASRGSTVLDTQELMVMGGLTGKATTQGVLNERTDFIFERLRTEHAGPSNILPFVTQLVFSHRL